MVVVVETATKLLVFVIFDKVQNPLRRPCETTYERPKVVRTSSVFNILTWKGAPPTTVYTLNISTSKSAPRLRFFCIF